MKWKQLCKDLIASLSPGERDACVIYLECRLIKARENLPWDGVRQGFDRESILAFIDLEPSLNWTHRGRYIVLNPEGDVREVIEVNKPPFLKQASPDLRVVYVGKDVAPWTLAAESL